MCVSVCLVSQLGLTLCDPVDCSPPASSVHGDSPGKSTRGLPPPSPGDLPNQRIRPRSPALHEDSLLSEPPGKLQHIEVGSLSFFQGGFWTQELNWGLLHCRQIVYHLSYPGSPSCTLHSLIYNLKFVPLNTLNLFCPILLSDNHHFFFPVSMSVSALLCLL